MSNNTVKEPIPMSILIPATLALEITHTVVNLVIIVLSLLKVKRNLCRTYALNHSILSIFFSTFMMIVDLSDVTGIGRDVFFKGPSSLYDKKMWAVFISAFLIRYTANSYRVFATLMVLLTYVSYTYPFVYSKLINDRSIIYIFAAGHGLVWLTIAMWGPSAVSDMFLHSSTKLQGDLFTKIFYGEKVFGFVMFTLMLVLYCLSIYKIIQFSKKQTSSSSQKRRSQLLSVLIYCTPPNIFLLLAMPRNLCIVVGSFGVNMAPVAVICDISRKVHSPMTTIRFFVSSICALVAFNDYRKIVLNLVLKFKFSAGNTSVVSVSSGPLVQSTPNDTSRK
uniref:G_PROTEIN_RECEP_F1_2 domain-containing protein n=1 Tax=Steinernema glaseri TaxID=37863 RepID=A0A1I7YNN4_9BILA